MNFTSLDSFSQHVAAVMLPLFSNSSTATRDLHDNTWLLWQLAWLYRDTHVVSQPLATCLKNFVAADIPCSAASDRIRHAWMQQIGYPEASRLEPAPAFHPAHKLRLLLTKIFPEAHSPETQLLRYLTSISGMPETEASLLVQWLTSPEARLHLPLTPPLMAVESYNWLAPDAVSAVLEGEAKAAPLLAQKNFHIIPLPTHVNRPASLMLADGSLWLCWPKPDSMQAPHPIVQATLVLHESSHLRKNADLFRAGGTPSAEADTLWNSEDSALRAEWIALEKLCAGQPETLRTHFKQRWYEENHRAQLRLLYSDWTQFCDTAPQMSVFSPEQVISLPFMSGVYASLAAKIYN
ncbi:MAG: hypothetical protein FJY29_05730 [Betaproteobacteria bacterium]|nr:hypothetical protein [Betaproteobacteria bacterium]